MTPTETFLAKCLELSERATLKEKIGIAIGEASMCWDPLPSGVFDSTDAIRISKELESDVFAVIDRLPKVCEALRIAMEALDYYGNKAFAQHFDHRGMRKPIDVTADWGFKAKKAIESANKLFDDADGG